MRANISLTSGILGLLVLTFISNAYALENGVYTLQPLPDGKVPDAKSAEPDEKISLDDFTLEVRSVSNFNGAFELELSFVPGGIPSGVYVAIVAGTNTLIETGGEHRFDHIGYELAEEVATALNAPLRLREHDGHKVYFYFKPQKEYFKKGEAPVVDAVLRNIGSSSIYVRQEVKSPPNRSSCITLSLGHYQFRKVSYLSEPKSPVSLYMENLEIRPNEEAILKSENLANWFLFEEGGSFPFMGTYDIVYFKNKLDTFPLWTEVMGARFAIRLSLDYLE